MRWRLPDTRSHLGNPAFSSFLDLSRWVAAWIVLFGHLRGPLFYSWADVAVQDRTLLVTGWYFVTGWFGEAVIVFFVLSGYLVGGIGIAKLNAGRFAPGDYAIDRFSRLYVAYGPALLLTLAVGLVGMRLLPDAGLYDGTHPLIAQKLGMDFAARDGIGNFVANLAMLQTFRTEPFGANPPLWTISAEFWFYVTFGLMVFTLMRGRRMGARLLAGGLLIGSLVLLTPLFLYYLGLWLLGAAVALVPSDRARYPLAYATTFGFILLASRVYTDQLLTLAGGQAIRDYGVAAGFALLLHAMREGGGRILQSLSHLNRRLADFSYSLYLVHFPLMIVLLATLYASGRFDGIATGYAPVDPVGLALYAGLGAVLLLLAWLFARMTEFHTGRIRARIKRVSGIDMQDRTP